MHQNEFARLEAAIPHDKDRFEWTIEDHLPELRLMIKGLVEPEPTDEELRTFVQENPHLRALAVEWGWDDTQVRDDSCAVIEKLIAQRSTSLGDGD